MINHFFKFKTEKLAGLLLVIFIHVALLYGAWSYKLMPPPKETVTLFVSLVSPPLKQEAPSSLPPKPEPPKKVKLDKPKSVERIQPVPVMVAEVPDNSATEYVKPVPEPTPPAEEMVDDEPVAESVEAVVELPKSSSPVVMSSELSLGCPKRTPPNYPAASRRAGEQGRVMLQVELDQSGHVASAKVKVSSGYKRLDEAGLSAVKNWQCNAAMRDGETVRATALQPFDFILN